MNNKLLESKENFLDLSNIKNIGEYSKLEDAGNIIKNGGLVLFPTETVYGIGANGLNEDAVKKIYVAKERKSDNPLILHISDIGMLGMVAKNISDMEFKLMNAFWPGPFTIILNKSDSVPLAVSGGLDTIGVRMPDNEIAINLIKFSEVPIAAPSANISGRPSGTNINDIYNELAGKVDYIIDGGDCNIGVESTVVRVIDDIAHILRPGKITVEEIKEVTGNVIVDKHVLEKLDKNEKIMSPGMKYQHYAPSTKCVLVYNENHNLLQSKIEKLSNDLLLNNKKPLIMVLAENYNYFKNIYKNNDNVKMFNMGFSLEDMSKNIFTDLRKADNLNVDMVIIEGVSSDGLGLAIMNRLLRACNYNLIK